MFALPNAKRVRRDELHSPPSSRASSPDPEILAQLRESTRFEFIEAVPPAIPNTDDVADEEEAEELAFNLFAPTSTTNAQSAATTNAPQRATGAQTIRLRSPSIDNATGDGGFRVPQRDPRYYFAGELSATKRAEYADAAVTGETVKDWAQRPCPGCSYPWKVIHISSSSAASAGARKTQAVVENKASEDFLPEEKKRKCRSSKKDRIKKRTKLALARAKKEEAEKGKEDKERLEREKRARRNREKKFKKRARDKAKKAAGGGGGDGTVDGDSDASDVSDGENEG